MRILRRAWMLLIAAIICLAFSSQEINDGCDSIRFIRGEKLSFRMYMGIFTVGNGVTAVDPNYYVKNNRPCYKVDAFMETSGLSTWVSKVRDNWGAYIDTCELVSYESYRQLREGKYRLNELTKYDQNIDKAYVQVIDKKSGMPGVSRSYSTPHKVRDIVAGFMYMRTIDFSKYKLLDTLTVSGFLEDKAYNFKIIYFGKETVVIGLGKIMCHKLIPIMPDNRLFRGKNSITAWVSADENQIPIKVEAKMFIGHAGTELVAFKGLRYQFKTLQ